MWSCVGRYAQRPKANQWHPSGATCEPQGSACLCLLGTWIINLCQDTWFYIQVLRLLELRPLSLFGKHITDLAPNYVFHLRPTTRCVKTRHSNWSASELHFETHTDVKSLYLGPVGKLKENRVQILDGRSELLEASIGLCSVDLESQVARLWKKQFTRIWLF